MMLYFYAFAAGIGLLIGYLLRGRALSLSLSAVSGWLLLQLSNCVGMRSADPRVAASNTESFFWMLVLLPGCAVAGLLGAGLGRALALLFRADK